MPPAMPPSIPPPPAVRPRRALSGQGGEVETRGPDELAAPLAEALAAGGTEVVHENATHGFHSYPARMHPEIAAALIDRFSAPGDALLDPFCGSGTVLIEAMRAGRRATGVDLNPLAIRVAEVQTALRSAADRERFATELARLGAASLERVQNRVRVRAALSERERAFYGPHVLLELAGLREEIDGVEREDDRRAFEMVFSALLVKFSLQRGDTSDELTEKRIRKGLVSEFFMRKGGELCRRWEALERDAGQGAVAPRLVLGDARELPVLLRGERFGLVVSSPPYGGTYDYHAHHARRYPWLRLDASALERGEIGARRRLSALPDGAQRWERELLACLRSLAGVCAAEANVLWLIGDPEVGEQRLDAAEQLRALSTHAGFGALAAASQRRRDARGGPPRREHLVLLRRN
jgi:hypothetical protein